MLKVLPGQRPSFTVMEDDAPCARVLHVTTGLLRGWGDVRIDIRSHAGHLIMNTDCHLTASANGRYVIQVVEGSYHLQLIRFDLNSSLQSAVNCFSAPYYQDYEQSTKYRTIADLTIHLNFLAVIINNTDMP